MIAREIADADLSDVEADAVRSFINAAVQLDTIAADRRSAWGISVVRHLAANLDRIEELARQLHIAAVYGGIDLPDADPVRAELMLGLADRIPDYSPDDDYGIETPADTVPRIFNVTSSGEAACV